MVGLKYCVLCLLAAAIWWPMTAASQVYVCPNGPGPGENQVGTTGGSNGVALMPLCASDGSGDSSEPSGPRSNPVAWESRWGAIAIGGGGWGAVTDMRSEKQAKKAAIKHCKETAQGNGSKCKAFSYYDQCAVIAWGETGYIVQSAVDLPTASSVGMQKCSSKHADCQIFYSACSYPKRMN
jgi:hypothetical protein